MLSGAVVTESPSGAAYLGPGARIGSGAAVDPLSSLGAGADVGRRRPWRAAWSGEEALIGDGAALIDAILGAGVRVGAGARIGEGAVVGDGASIAAGFRVDGSEPIPTGASVG